MGFSEAAEIGIDNLEHGPPSTPNSYLEQQAGTAEVVKDLAERVDIGSVLVQDMILMLWRTISRRPRTAVFEPWFRTGRRNARNVCGWCSRRRPLAADLAQPGRRQDRPQAVVLLKKEMQFERIVKAGGLPLAGAILIFSVARRP